MNHKEMTILNIKRLHFDTYSKIFCPSLERKIEIIEIAKKNNLYFDGMEKRIKIGLNG